MNNTPTSCAQINRKIRHLNLTIQHQRGDGYFYFTDSTTGRQAGESVWVCYLHGQDMAGWICDAEHARKALDAEEKETAGASEIFFENKS